MNGAGWPTCCKGKHLCSFVGGGCEMDVILDFRHTQELAGLVVVSQKMGDCVLHQEGLSNTRRTRDDKLFLVRCQKLKQGVVGVLLILVQSLLHVLVFFGGIKNQPRGRLVLLNFGVGIRGSAVFLVACFPMLSTEAVAESLLMHRFRAMQTDTRVGSGGSVFIERIQGFAQECFLHFLSFVTKINRHFCLTSYSRSQGISLILDSDRDLESVDIEL